MGVAKSDSGDLLDHVAEVSRVGRDECGVVPLGGSGLPLGDLASGGGDGRDGWVGGGDLGVGGDS